jgi:hypothetical protein
MDSRNALKLSWDPELPSPAPFEGLLAVLQHRGVGVGSKLKGDQMSYFVLTTGSGANVEQMTKGELEDRLNENYWGETEWCTDLSTSIDLLAERVHLVIKGEIVAPREVETVVKLEIP